MPADRLLNTVLQYYQDQHDAAKTEQIIGTTAHLLAQLSNPLNLGVLTSQLLTAPAIWRQPEGLRTAIRIISIYNTAATRVHQHEVERATGKMPQEGGGLQCDEWTRAVVKGADDRSRRWQHLLVLTGVLMGMEADEKQGLSRSLRNTLESAVVTAANMALEDHMADGPIAGGSTVMALNFAFPLMSEHHRLQINCNALLPVAVWTITGEEGFRDGQFLQAIGRDAIETPGHVVNWPAASPSFHLLQEMDRRPLMSNMGPLSKLAGFAAQHATNPRMVLQAQESLFLFSVRLLDAWQQLTFSGIDPALEGASLSAETAQQTYPALWQVLKKLLFAVVVVLQSILSRSLMDPALSQDTTVQTIAARSLQILRNLCFVSSRDGNSSFQVYTFTYMASIDALSRFGGASEKFLRDAKLSGDGSLPTRHIQRTLDVFYLDLAEHLPLALSTEACDELIVKPALAYMSHEGPMSPSMVGLFESAHSSVLSVMSCPQHSALTIRMAPFYIVKLFESFPHYISPRQFRVAFKTVMQIVSPPFPIAAMEPYLSETLLEMLRSHMATASPEPLPQDVISRDAASQATDEVLSEQSSLALALIDSLPFLPLPLVEDWLTVAAQALNEIEDPNLRETVKKRFWDMLVSGELDVERAAIGVAWWGTKGGRDLVLYGRPSEPPVMSGALVGEEKSSRL